MSKRLPINKCYSGTANLRFEYVSTTEQFQKLIALGKEFDHNLENFKFPYVLYYWNDEPIGFCQIVDCPTFFPAFHPKKSTPRAVMEIMKAFYNYAKLNPRFAQEGICAVPVDSKTFTSDILLKMGFIREGYEIYSTRN